MNGFVVAVLWVLIVLGFVTAVVLYYEIYRHRYIPKHSVKLRHQAYWMEREKLESLQEPDLEEMSAWVAQVAAADA